jgi:hypothetical protein
MSNQVILWAMFIVPWLTLFLMKMEDIRRLMPLALFSALTSVIIHEVGISLRWWEVLEMAYPLQLLPYLIGLHPVLTMWIFKFTFRKFWLYMAVEAVTNLGFNSLFLGYFLPLRGILHFVDLSGIAAFCLTMSHGIILYGYQLWQERIIAHPYRQAENKK